MEKDNRNNYYDDDDEFFNPKKFILLALICLDLFLVYRYSGLKETITDSGIISNIKEFFKENSVTHFSNESSNIDTRYYIINFKNDTNPPYFNVGKSGKACRPIIVSDSETDKLYYAIAVENPPSSDYTLMLEGLMPIYSPKEPERQLTLKDLIDEYEKDNLTAIPIPTVEEVKTVQEFN